MFEKYNSIASKMKNYLWMMIFLAILNSSVSIKFYFQMESTSMRCLGEYLSDNTLAIINIKSSNSEVRVRLFDPNGNTVMIKENLPEIKFSYTSEESGNHQICIDNYGRSDIRIDFEFLYGIAARDYSDLAKKKNFSPIEINLEKLEDMGKYLSHSLTSIMDSDDKTNQNHDYATKNIIFFSMLLIVLTIFSGMIETLFLKRYFRHRKLI